MASPEKSTSPDPQPSGAASSNWWGGWLQTVKDSTQSLVNIYREDLSEFGRTVVTDTKSFVGDVSKKVDDVSKQNPSSLATSVTTTFATGVTGVTGGLTSLFSTISSSVSSAAAPPMAVVPTHAEQLQKVATFEKSPEDAEFDSWVKSFQVETRKEEVAKILATNSSIFDLYQQIVPSELSPQEFWGRYFFRLEKMQEKEVRRTEMLRKAHELAQEEVSWDDEEPDVTPKASETSVPPPAAAEENADVISLPDAENDEPAPEVDKPVEQPAEATPPATPQAEDAAPGPETAVEPPRAATPEPQPPTEVAAPTTSSDPEPKPATPEPQLPVQQTTADSSAPSDKSTDEVFDWE